MTMLMYFLGGLLLGVLVLMGSAQPARSSLSLFELRRRQKLRDDRAEEVLRREEFLARMSALKTPLSALCLIVLTILLIYLLGWKMGIAAALLVGLLYGRLASTSPVRRLANKLYRRLEDKLLSLVAKHESRLSVITGKITLKEKPRPLGSREELAHLLDISSIFTDEDKRLLRSTLRFKDRTVKDVMTSREDIVTVDVSELLGPLVLDDLHKTGHTIFPVTKGRKIVGILDSTDHAGLRTKESVYARSVMRTDIALIEENTPLDKALKMLIAVNQPLLIVINADDEETGVISLGDIVRSLTGWHR